ncbi:hypothetical protein UFOVP849_10 [uncultured Caudovirales phage]|uniref:Uncharacterized protein n=1 Tax=uncultured Caudovirales phage TaxID=2100421 RepID=A0A6J5P3M7_9CAUD|nr:hypothetical protein UFOVP849_10 [uncultured Caudovirales phage]
MKAPRQNRLRELNQRRHLNCPMTFKTQGPHTGMYCATHGTWIKWISQKDLETLR